MKGKKGNDVGVGHSNPSMTTSVSVNPSFRVYEMDNETYDLLDYVEYTLNITKSNEEEKENWEEAYRFTSKFSLPDMSIKSYRKLVNEMKVVIHEIRHREIKNCGN